MRTTCLGVIVVFLLFKGASTAQSGGSEEPDAASLQAEGPVAEQSQDPGTASALKPSETNPPLTGIDEPILEAHSHAHNFSETQSHCSRSYG